MKTNNISNIIKRLIKIKQCHSSKKWSTTNSIENDTHFDAHEGSALIVRNNDIHFGTFEVREGYLHQQMKKMEGSIDPKSFGGVVGICFLGEEDMASCVMEQ